jgi:hypothetical protein
MYRKSDGIRVALNQQIIIHSCMEMGMLFYIYNGIIPAVKRVEFGSDRMSYVMLRGHWCYIIVLNVHALTENNYDATKDNFYKKLERVFDQFRKYHIKIMLGDFNAKVRRADIFKPTIRNEFS